MQPVVAAYQANDILGFEKILRTNRRARGLGFMTRVWIAPCSLERLWQCQCHDRQARRAAELACPPALPCVVLIKHPYFEIMPPGASQKTGHSISGLSASIA